MHPRRRSWWPVVVVCAAVLGASVGAAAPTQAPANDDLARATFIASLPFADTVSALDATDEPGEVVSACAGAAPERGVWYRLTATGAGVVVIETEGSLGLAGELDTVLSVWTGSGAHPLGEAVCNDDARPQVAWSRVTLRVVPSRSYYIKVAGRGGDVGALSLRARLAANVPPNDDLSGARAIGRTPYADRQDTTDATDEDAETVSACADSTMPENGVWYRLDAVDSARFTFDTSRSTAVDGELDSVLSLWFDAPGHPLREIACNDDVAGHLWSRLQLDAEAGRTYLLKAGVQFGQRGSLELSVTSERGVPPNDDLGGARMVGPLPYADIRDNHAATDEPREARASCAGGAAPERGLWYRYPATVDERLALDADGSDLDLVPVVSAWTGGGTHPLAEVACARGDVSGAQPLLVDVRAGTSLFVKVGTEGDVGGSVALNVARVLVPPNDDLAAATAVTTLPFADRQDVRWAGDEPGEARASCADGTDAERGVWYRYRPAVATTIVVTADDASVAAVVSAWRGGAHPLAETGCAVLGGGTGSRDWFEVDAAAGSELYLKAAGYRGLRGVVGVQIAARPGAPGNDDLADATLIDREPFSDRRDVRWATDEPDEVRSRCVAAASAAPEHGVWYRVAPGRTMPLRLSTLGSDFDTVLSIWTGDAGHPLTEVACSDDANGRWSQLELRPAAGVTYYVKAGGQAGAVGEVVVRTSPWLAVLPMVLR